MNGRIAIVVALTIAFAGAAPFACSEFEPAADDALDAASETTSEAAVQGDAASGDAVASGDASVRTIQCGDETCSLPDEVCCVFWGGQLPALRFCAETVCPAKAPSDAGYPNKVAVKCDDPTDCETPGNVCCAATAACSLGQFTAIECRAPAACPSCEADAAGKLGHELCRATLSSDCADGSVCTGTFTGNPQWNDYRFCK